MGIAAEASKRAEIDRDGKEPLGQGDTDIVTDFQGIYHERNDYRASRRPPRALDVHTTDVGSEKK